MQQQKEIVQLLGAAHLWANHEESWTVSWGQDWGRPTKARIMYARPDYTIANVQILNTYDLIKNFANQGARDTILPESVGSKN